MNDYLEILLFALLFQINLIFLLFIILSIINIRTNTKIYNCRDVVANMITTKYIINKYPLKDKIVIITGSTSGLGEKSVENFYNLGATVIIASRTINKCYETMNNIKKNNYNTIGIIDIIQLDTSDFDSVRNFVKKFNEKYSKLHILINNAGIHYISSPGCPLFNPKLLTISKQGFDLAFATNYMGHWLLTDLLLPILTKTGKEENNTTRIVNVSSAYHLAVNGNNCPDAAKTNILKRWHRRRSYGNSKLAQILHTNELNIRLKNENNYNVEIVSICPGWVSGTGIVHETFVGAAIKAFGYELEAGTLAVMGASLNANLRGGEHITNYIPFWTNTIPFDLLNKFNIRDITADLLAMVLLFIQLNSYGFHISKSSPESYNMQLAKELYDWTSVAVKKTSS